MFIYLNGKEEEIEADMCLLKLIERKRIRQEVVTVEQNGQIIDKGKFKDTLLSEGDKVEFVYYMGGGTAWLN
jgi:thiamine biosynthesis protein ThiS